ncbi:rhamnogalacturonidase [Hirschia baltica]|uniref:Polygalacturonase n=1 Tax=Hirschia baltica (strain ATCC 49814 / DSM 5838 / IFAM 1418) TaxID=582402 RepID=C6XQD6_HIRBI|nr:glycoside hydrolase family 28 protein [Hirschia baltica]ACT60435.1 polygalacturonase [Hirschia baltica ATCC 49814]
MYNRRKILLAGSAGLAATSILTACNGAALVPNAMTGAGIVNIRDFGTKGDGSTIDSHAINRAIDHAASMGGGMVFFPAGTYSCFTIRLKSNITLYLDNGAIIKAAPNPEEGSPGYDLPEPIDPAIKDYQDFGHSHFQNSLIWGENLENVSIIGDGLIWGKNLSRGDGSYNYMDDPHYPGTGNKAIALKNCRNVLLRDFKMLEGGWFALLATGVDNLTIDNLIVDTTRDGFDIDCCRSVRVSNCTVNSPWDDGICLKSSYALGYARATENVSITNCFVTGNYEIGSVLDGTWKKMPASFAPQVHGRIKFGTESNGGYKNITINNCTFEDSQGFALETVDGGDLEDVTISNCTMRGNYSSPIFLRLGRRMRGPEDVPIAKLRRISITNITSSSAAILPSIIAGIPGHPVEDVKIADCYFHQIGGAPEELASRVPPLEELGYPEPNMFGDLPATGFYIRDARNVEMSNIEIAVEKADPRAAFWLRDVEGADFFRMQIPSNAPAFYLNNVSDFRSFGSTDIADTMIAKADSEIF